MTVSCYSPQRHAKQLAESTDLLAFLVAQVARIEGNVQLLLETQRAQAEGDRSEVFDFLVDAIFHVFAENTWTIGDLLRGAVVPNASAATLASALTAIGGDLSAKSLGRFISTQVKGGYRKSGNGYEVRFSGKTRTVNAYRVSRVSNHQTNTAALTPPQSL